jgi:DNA gyrase/topoisomerase IV subunit B
LYGAIKGKDFVPIYNFSDTKNYREKKYEIKRFKGLGEMNPNQLEATIRSGKEYIISYPEDMNMINLIVNNTDIRKKLMETDICFQNLINGGI